MHATIRFQHEWDHCGRSEILRQRAIVLCVLACVATLSSDHLTVSCGHSRAGTARMRDGHIEQIRGVAHQHEQISTAVIHI